MHGVLMWKDRMRSMCVYVCVADEGGREWKKKKRKEKKERRAIFCPDDFLVRNGVGD